MRLRMLKAPEANESTSRTLFMIVKMSYCDKADA